MADTSMGFESSIMSKRFDSSSGPTQRQLRAGENIRHVLVAILRKGEIRDPALLDKSITVGEVRMSPDLKHANIFVAALGIHDAEEIAAALNRASKYLRGECGRALASKFTPDLRFLADASYDAALKMNELFNDPKVRADLERVEDDAPPQSLRDSSPASGASTTLPPQAGEDN